MALPFAAGPSLAAALHGSDPAVRSVASTQLWLGWALGVVAVLIPHPVALTAIRLLAPGAVVAGAAALRAGHPSAVGTAVTVVACALAFGAPVGARWVNGPAYPNERRFLLRAPGPLLFGPLALVWAAIAGGTAAGPLLVAAGRPAAGVAAVVTGGPLVWLLVRSVHHLSRRWAVFVPAGMVLHDPMSLVDPFLFARQHVVSLRPARAGTDALDLTQRSPGVAVELALDEPAGLGLLRPGRRLGQPVEATAVLFTPSRPGDLLEEARRRRLGTPAADRRAGS